MTIGDQSNSEYHYCLRIHLNDENFVKIQNKNPLLNHATLSFLGEKLKGESELPFPATVVCALSLWN